MERWEEIKFLNAEDAEIFQLSVKKILIKLGVLGWMIAQCFNFIRV